jgi:hypothetical protein
MAITISGDSPNFTAATITTGTVTTLTTTTISDGTNSTSATNPIRGSAKAWVRFSVSGTTPTITSSYNISSVTFNATGYYSFEFTSALANANYAVTSSGSINTAGTAFTNSFAFGTNTGSYYLAPTTLGFTMAYVASSFENPLVSNIAVFSS